MARNRHDRANHDTAWSEVWTAWAVMSPTRTGTSDPQGGAPQDSARAEGAGQEPGTLAGRRHRGLGHPPPAKSSAPSLGGLAAAPEGSRGRVLTQAPPVGAHGGAHPAAWHEKPLAGVQRWKVAIFVLGLLLLGTLGALLAVLLA